MKLIFYGTPYFAVPTLKKIVDNGFDVLAVVTAPDKPAGRGRELQMSEVKIAALTLGLTVLQPTSLKSAEFIETIHQLNPDVQVVVAFRMLPEAVWSFPQFGTINLHASLLPDYRGAAPINYAIINGEQKTGLTTFRLKHEIDTGDVLLQTEITIDAEDNAGSLHDKMLSPGADLMIKTLNGIANGNLMPTPQNRVSKKVAPKIQKETGHIKFETMTANQVHLLVRGLNPFPGSFATLNLAGNAITFKISKGKIGSNSQLEAGQIYTNAKNLIEIGCLEGNYQILECQIPGKKRLLVDEFLRGFNFLPDYSFKDSTK